MVQCLRSLIYSCRGSNFNSQKLHGGSQYSETPVTEDLTSLLISAGMTSI